MISSTQMRPGMVVKFNNDLFSVFSVAHRTPGNLRGFVQAKMRNLRSGTMIEHRFSSEDKVERAIMDEVEMEYLYDDGQNYYFMNTENYEQTHLSKDLLGDATSYLIPQLKVKVEFYEGKPISVELPATIDMTVVETEPGIKGASVSNVTKPAKMETGLVVQVPAFIKGKRKDPSEYRRRHLSRTRIRQVTLAAIDQLSAFRPRAHTARAYCVSLGF
jgi:elongation factor P